MRGINRRLAVGTGVSLCIVSAVVSCSSDKPKAATSTTTEATVTITVPTGVTTTFGPPAKRDIPAVRAFFSGQGKRLVDYVMLTKEMIGPPNPSRETCAQTKAEVTRLSKTPDELLKLAAKIPEAALRSYFDHDI